MTEINPLDNPNDDSHRFMMITEKEAAHIMVLLSETPALLERAQKIMYPVTEKELLAIVDKARKICWAFHHDRQRKKAS